MKRQAALDFDRRYILATGDDQIVNPAGDEQVAVGILKSGIAGKVPAVADGRGIGIGAAPIALEGLVAGKQRDDFAFLARCSNLSDGSGAETNDPNHLIDAGAPGRAGLGRRILIDRDGVDFRTAIVVDEQFRAKPRIEFFSSASVIGAPAKPSLRTELTSASVKRG